MASDSGIGLLRIELERRGSEAALFAARVERDLDALTRDLEDQKARLARAEKELFGISVDEINVGASLTARLELIEGMIEACKQAKTDKNRAQESAETSSSWARDEISRWGEWVRENSGKTLTVLGLVLALWLAACGGVLTELLDYFDG